MNEIQIFQNQEFGAIRTMSNEQGEPMFCLKDVCDVLELRTQKVVQRLEDDVLSKYPIVDTLGRTQQATFVNEDGLYDTILESRKPQAKLFRKWVTSEVLPSIPKRWPTAIGLHGKHWSRTGNTSTPPNNRST